MMESPKELNNFLALVGVVTAKPTVYSIDYWCQAYIIAEDDKTFDGLRKTRKALMIRFETASVILLSK